MIHVQDEVVNIYNLCPISCGVGLKQTNLSGWLRMDSWKWMVVEIKVFSSRELPNSLRFICFLCFFWWSFNLTYHISIQIQRCHFNPLDDFHRNRRTWIPTTSAMICVLHLLSGWSRADVGSEDIKPADDQSVKVAMLTLETSAAHISPLVVQQCSYVDA